MFTVLVLRYVNVITFMIYILLGYLYLVTLNFLSYVLKLYTLNNEKRSIKYNFITYEESKLFNF